MSGPAIFILLLGGHYATRQTHALSSSHRVSCLVCAGGCAQGEEEAAGLSRGSGVCKWFNMRMGFGFLSMSSRDGDPLEEPLDVFVHQVRRMLYSVDAQYWLEETLLSTKICVKTVACPDLGWSHLCIHSYLRWLYFSTLQFVILMCLKI